MAKTDPITDTASTRVAAIRAAYLLEQGAELQVPFANFRTHTLTAGNYLGVTLNYSSLSLADAPSKIYIVNISKTVSGDSVLMGFYIEGSATTTSAVVDLSAPCDTSGRKIYYIVIP
jgi:hypothetical protein